MNIVRVTLAALALSTLGLAGCGGGVEGTYKIDKAEMKKAMEADIAKLPEDQQGMAKLGVAMLDALEMTLDLEAGGKLKLTTKTPSFEKDQPAKTETKEGTWKMDGESVVLDNGDGKPAKCVNAGGKLTCTGEKDEPTMVFVKGA